MDLLEVGARTRHGLRYRPADLRRVAVIVLTVLAAGVVFGQLVALIQLIGFSPTDGSTYLGAGERLNAGHNLYALSPGDRPLLGQSGIPLVSPPFIAVLWRPLAALGEWILLPWTILCGLAAVASVAIAWRSHPIATSLSVIALSGPLLIVLTSGNVNGLLMLGMAVAVARPRTAPFLIGVMAAVKVWPILLAIALIRTRRDIALLVATLAVCAVVSLVGAGWQAHLDYVGVARGLGGYQASLASITGIALLPIAALLVGIVLAARGSHRAAILATVLGNPALSLGSWATILPALVDRWAERKSSAPAPEDERAAGFVSLAARVPRTRRRASVSGGGTAARG